ncbi:hypothetical protein YPPY103_1504, partial [Yersinia pestis PY-103]
MNFGNDS